MEECTAKAIAEETCNLFEVDPDDSETFFKVYDIIRDNIYKHEGTLLPIA